MLRIVTIAPADYVRDVLPLSAELWAGERDAHAYAAEFEDLCATGFGKRRFRTLGLSIDGSVVASCKRYQRELRCGDRTYRATGIGAVFTPKDFRGRGYATAFLGALLDAERAAGTDFIYLFSDIRAEFYERLGFSALPSRAISLRADTLPHARIDMQTLGEDDWPAVERAFATAEASRPFALTRPPLVWEWMRLRARSHESAGVLVRVGIARGRRLAAYVIGRRFPAADAFALDEFAAIDFDASAQLPSLIRNAAGDLRKVTGWLPPDPARGLIPRGAVRTRKTALAMLLPLSPGARAAWERSAPTVADATADPYWNADHI